MDTNKNQRYVHQTWTDVWYKTAYFPTSGGALFYARRKDAIDRYRYEGGDVRDIVVPYNRNHLNVSSDRHYDLRGNPFHSISIDLATSIAVEAALGRFEQALTLAAFYNIQAQLSEHPGVQTAEDR